ncbi:lysozyme inhibitor LprI family protein [Pseudovibrio exalbescens]|uniref:Lysozyme inhibitor LprI-like N-terminal domain-containing protein n=1 Tax=Pseudovibrio exalbescens TaxID=197461 RepID=A0A1U7JIZ0_9HYPH|nr:lysozyme inhibitor LprI family protein [Pseudovibrio exalbescens]OKL44621.1 hypothetical protein A3843_09615 [Pseudovibrio exalbescens]
MKNLGSALFSIPLAFLATTLHADEIDECQKTLGAAQRHLCADAEYRKAAVQLLKTYEQAQNAINTMDAPEDRKALARQRLESNQTAWVSYRDTTCNIVSNLTDQMAPKTAKCLTKLTRERTDDLEKLLESGAVFAPPPQ